MKKFLICFLFVSFNVSAAEDWYGVCAEKGADCMGAKVPSIKLEKGKTGSGLPDCFEVTKGETLKDGSKVKRVAYYECRLNGEILLRLKPSEAFETIRLYPAIPYIEKNGVKAYHSAEDKPSYTRGIVEGEIPYESIRVDFMAEMPKFRSCHQSNLESGGSAGKVNVEFFINKKGFAYNPKVTGDAPKSVVDCVTSVLVKTQFQPYTKGEDVKVTQPINFKTVNLDKD